MQFRHAQLIAGILNLIKVVIDSSCAYVGGGEGRRSVTACKLGKSQQYEMKCQKSMQLQAPLTEVLHENVTLHLTWQTYVQRPPKSERDQLCPGVTAWARSANPLRRKGSQDAGPSAGERRTQASEAAVCEKTPGSVRLCGTGHRPAGESKRGPRRAPCNREVPDYGSC